MLKTLLPEELANISTKSLRKLLVDIAEVEKAINDEISKKSTLDRIILLKTLTAHDLAAFTVGLGITIALNRGLFSDFFRILTIEGDGIGGAFYLMGVGVANIGTLGAILSAFDFYSQPLTYLSASSTEKVSNLIEFLETSCGLVKNTFNRDQSIQYFRRQLADINAAATAQLGQRQYKSESETQRLQKLADDLQKIGMFAKSSPSNIETRLNHASAGPAIGPGKW